MGAHASVISSPCDTPLITPGARKPGHYEEQRRHQSRLQARGSCTWTISCTMQIDPLLPQNQIVHVLSMQLG